MCGSSSWRRKWSSRETRPGNLAPPAAGPGETGWSRPLRPAGVQHFPGHLPNPPQPWELGPSISEPGGMGGAAGRGPLPRCVPLSRAPGALLPQPESGRRSDPEGGGEGAARAHQAGVPAAQAAADPGGAGAGQPQVQAEKAAAQVGAPGRAAGRVGGQGLLNP